MAEEAVIFPSQPLFMVDRSWQRRGRKVSPTKDTENSSRVPEVTITVLNGGNKSRKEQSRLPISDPSSNPQPKNVKVQFMNYQPNERRRPRIKNPNVAAKGRDGVEQPRKRRQNQNSAVQYADPAEPSEHLSILSRAVPKSNSAVYAVIDSEVTAFERFLMYYPTRLAEAIFPMGQYLNFEYNTLAKIWLPAAVNDEVLLHTILFASALHHYSVSGGREFKDAHLLMKVILDRLNRRMQAKTLSDPTIGAVSCLAMCENMLGKHSRFAMHMSGMAEMIRIRGGMANIRHELQMKIYRADIAGAVDALSKPHLPPLQKTSIPLYETLKLKTTHKSPLEIMLADSGLSPNIVTLLEEVSRLSLAIEHAMDTQSLLNPLLFEEETMCLQYNLLMAISWTGKDMDNACSIAALIFMQTLTRALPFTHISSHALSLELEVSLLNLEMATVPSPLMFWMLVMGGMVSTETSEKDWFRRKLRECQVSWIDKITWETTKAQLLKVIWIDTIHDKYGKGLWEETYSACQMI